MNRDSARNQGDILSTNRATTRFGSPSQPMRGRRWLMPVGLLLLSAALLWLSFAPFNLYFLAWIGLVPWIIAVARTGSKKSAFAWGFAGGWAFFLASMWWLWFVTVPGMFALTLYLATFWGFAAILMRAVLRPKPPSSSLHLPSSLAAILLIPTAWTAFEWLRGNISFLGKQGLPWLFLGQSQSPILVMCQIADITSVLGISFWVVMVNTLVTLVLLHRDCLRSLIPAIATVVVVMLAIGAYGAFRLAQQTTYPGPHVMVVQSNYPQSNTGEKGAPMSEIVEFHVNTTRRALQHCLSRGQQVDLVVWSETMMPPINRSARDFTRGTQLGLLGQRTYEAISELADEFRISVLVGSVYHDDWSERDGYLVAADRRNSAFLFDRTGTLSDVRYDKVHLVPFGEYIPFKESIPPLYRLFIKLGPNYYEEYTLTRGRDLTVFSLETGASGEPIRFVVPICFEDIVPSLVAKMLDGHGSKRADFLINITNDGWFRAGQMPQHLQAALFRCIANRVPTARSVNTGISGFIDPTGRIGQTIAAGTEGWAVSRLMLDRRVALYTRIGDAFPIACVAITGAAIAGLIVRHRRNKRVTE